MTNESLKREAKTTQEETPTRTVPANVQASNEPGKTSPAHCVRNRALDEHGSHIVKFSYAFVSFLLLAGGLLTMGWGVTITSRLVAVVGLIAMLIGGTMYGRSLFDE